MNPSAWCTSKGQDVELDTLGLLACSYCCCRTPPRLEHGQGLLGTFPRGQAGPVPPWTCPCEASVRNMQAASKLETADAARQQWMMKPWIACLHHCCWLLAKAGVQILG